MIMNFCADAYRLTGDPKWIERAALVVRVHQKRQLKLSFQTGIFLEGLRRYYEMSGDESAYEYLKTAVDRMREAGRRWGAAAHAYSLVYLKTGEAKYLEAALESLPGEGRFGNPWKDYALAMRNAALCIGDLYRAELAARAPSLQNAPSSR
jgi:hypothetical protein